MKNISSKLYMDVLFQKQKLPGDRKGPRRALTDEWISAATGVFLALFMWTHMLFVGSILTGQRGFDFVSNVLETTWLAQLIVILVTVAFFVHFVTASRKIPGKLSERRRMMELGRTVKGARKRWNQDPRSEIRHRDHSETSLWIWQVRTGMIILAIGSIHLFVVVADIWQRTFGGAGITASESMARVQDGMWILYAVLLFCVELHAGIGLYRVAVKWGVGSRIPFTGKRMTRQMAHRSERIVLWFFTIIGIVTLLVLAGVLAPPLALLLPESGGSF
ncbi:MAG: hypothetical protein V3U24_09995 [Candidatus Neomarinimicrobiota bacterium]